MQDLEDFIIQLLDGLIDPQEIELALKQEDQSKSLVALVINKFIDQQMIELNLKEQITTQKQNYTLNSNKFQQQIDMLTLENNTLKISSSAQICEESFFKAFEKKNQECIKLSSLIEEIQFQYQNYRDLFAVTCDEKNEKITTQSKRIRQLQLQLDDYTSQSNIQLEDQINYSKKIEQDYQLLDKQTHSNQRIIQSLEQQNAEYLQEIELLQKTIEQTVQIEQDNQNHLQSLANLNQQLTDLSTKTQKDQIQIQKLSHQLNETVQSNSQTQKLTQENISLKQQLTQLEEAFNTQLKEVDNKDSSVISKELNFIQKINILQDENQNLQQFNLQSQDQILDLQNQIANLFIENDNLNTQISQNEQQLILAKRQADDAKITQLQNKLQINESHLTHKDKENQSLKSDNQRLKAEISAMKNLQESNNKPDLSEILLVEQQELQKFQEKIMLENKNLKVLLEKKNELISELEETNNGQLKNSQVIIVGQNDSIDVVIEKTSSDEVYDKIVKQLAGVLESYYDIMTNVFSPGVASPKCQGILSQIYLDRQDEICECLSAIAQVNQNCNSYIVLKKIVKLFTNQASVKSLILKEKLDKSMDKTQVFDADDESIVDINNIE